MSDKLNFFCVSVILFIFLEILLWCVTVTLFIVLFNMSLLPQDCEALEENGYVPLLCF